MKKNTIRITESQLHNVIKESVKRILKEDKNFKFREGDKVIVHSRKGDFEGIVSDYDYNIMTWNPSYDIECTNGKTMIGVPETAIELVEQGSDDDYQRRLAQNKFLRQMQ